MSEIIFTLANIEKAFTTAQTRFFEVLLAPKLKKPELIPVFGPKRDRSSPVLKLTMISILKEVGHSMHYRTILYRVLEKGIHVAGVDRKRTINSHLSLNSEFEKEGDGIWGLSDGYL